MASASQHFGNLEAGSQNSISQGIFIQNAPLPSALERKPFRHGNPPPLNRNFLGREIEVATNRAAFCKVGTGEQKRYVIYGMAGIGKSEISVKIFNEMRNEFWGLFWVNVSNVVSAEGDLKRIADQIRPGTIHQTLDDALSALAEVDCDSNPWLLILDNADELREDYARFFPSGPGGSILLTSRNHECAIHETVGSWELELMSFQDSVVLLFKAAKLHQRDWESYRPQAEAITKLLGSHTLTLIHAGAFISRDVGNWHEYPRIFKENRQRLLTTSLNQARSKYGNVYATFDVSARTLESDGSTEAMDALDLLGIFAMFHHSGFPTSVFRDALAGANHMKTVGHTNHIDGISTGLVKFLPAFLSESEASNLRLQAGLYCLEALSFIKQATIDNEKDVKLVSMHPLSHAWAKDRLDQKSQEHAWAMTGSMIAHSIQSPYFGFLDNWGVRIRHLQPHISSFLDKREACKICDPLEVQLQVDFVVAEILREFRLRQKLISLLYQVFELVQADPHQVENDYLLPFYRKMAYAQGVSKQYQTSLDLWRQIILVEEKNSLSEAQILASKHDLAVVYIASGAIHDAIVQFENIVSIMKEKYPADDPTLLDSQHELGRAYQENGQVEEGIKLLAHVVRTEQETHPKSSQTQLTSLHELGRAYLANGQPEKAIEWLGPAVRIKRTRLIEGSPSLLRSEYELGRAFYELEKYHEAIQLFLHVARVRRTTLPPTDPAYLMTLEWLVDLYDLLKQPRKAKQMVVEFDNILRDVPKDDDRWHEYGGWLADRKDYFGIEEESQGLAECDSYFLFDVEQGCTNLGIKSGIGSDAGTDESRPGIQESNC